MNNRKLVTAVVLVAVFLAGGVLGAASVRILSSPPASAAAVDESGTDGATGGERTARADGRTDGKRGGDRDGDDRDGDDDRRRHPVYRIVSFLNEELELTDRQEAEVEQIIDARRERAHEIFDEMRSRFRSQLDSTISELKEVLTEEQVPRLEQHLEEMRERREEERREKEKREDGRSERG